MNILFVLGSGGHASRGISLSKRLGTNCSFIVPWESELTKEKLRRDYTEKTQFFCVLSPRFRAKDNVIMTGFRTIFLFFHSLFILLSMRPDLVISTGSGLTVPIFLIAQFLRIKTVYIESPSRVFEPSIAGRLLIGKTTAWLSSWIELATRYKNVGYGGIIY